MGGERDGLYYRRYCFHADKVYVGSRRFQLFNTVDRILKPVHRVTALAVLMAVPATTAPVITATATESRPSLKRSLLELYEYELDEK